MSQIQNFKYGKFQGIILKQFSDQELLVEVIQEIIPKNIWHWKKMWAAPGH